MKAILERDTVTAGETVKFSLVIEGATPEFAPQPPSILNLVLEYQSSSQQFTVVNGRSSRTITLDYALTPRAAGTYTIPSLSLNAGGTQLASNPVQLKVIAPDPNDPLGVGKIAFLRLILPKTEIFIGEVLPLEIQLYVQTAEDLQLPQLSGDGFTFSKPFEAGRSRGQQNGQLYNVLVFKLTALAAKTGELKLGPAECELTLLVQKPRTRRADPFDGFGDISDFFGGRAERRRTKLVSNSAAIVVKPLPTEGRPPEFSGAVGQFTFSSSASPTSLSTGDPITIICRLAGRGNLDAVQWNVPSSWNNFRTYPPTSKIEADPLGVQGTKTFEQVIAPEIAEIQEIPAFRFAFFDPEAKAYKTIQNPAVPLKIKAVDVTQAQPVQLATATKQIEPPASKKDIVHIKSKLGPAMLNPLASSFIYRPGFWAVNLVPIMALIAAMIWRKRWEHIQNNPQERRRREVSKAVQSALKDLHKFSQNGDSSGFFQTLFRVLQEQIGEKIGSPASSITESIIDDQLRPAGYNPKVLEDLHELFQLCNLARYAPQQIPRDLASVLSMAQNSIEQLKAHKK